MQKNPAWTGYTEPGDINAEVFVLWSFSINRNGFKTATTSPHQFATAISSREIVWREKFFWGQRHLHHLVSEGL